MPEQGRHQRRTRAHRARAKRADRCDQRFALPRAERRAGARRAALHRHRQDRLRYEPHAVLLRPVLPEIAGRDVRALERPSRSLREHRANRRAHRHPDSGEDLPPAAVSRTAAARRPGAQRCRVPARALRASGCASATARSVSASTLPCANGWNTSSSVITKMGFSSYFLIVWDFIKYARDHEHSRSGRDADRRSDRWSHIA